MEEDRNEILRPSPRPKTVLNSCQETRNQYKRAGGAECKRAGGAEYKRAGGAEYKRAGGAEYKRAGGAEYKRAGGAELVSPALQRGERDCTGSLRSPVGTVQGDYLCGNQ